MKDNHFSLEQGRELYSSAILGGMNNKGNVLNGSEDAIREEVKGILDAFGTKGIMIGADCTIQGENISLDLIKTAVEAGTCIQEIKSKRRNILWVRRVWQHYFVQQWQ